MPTFADKADLQYTLGFVKEALRWRPVSSGGFMHETTEELGYVCLAIRFRPPDAAARLRHPSWHGHRRQSLVDLPRSGALPRARYVQTGAMARAAQVRVGAVGADDGQGAASFAWLWLWTADRASEPFDRADPAVSRSTCA